MAILAVFTLLLAGGCSFGIYKAYGILAARSALSMGQKRDELVAQIESSTTELTELLKYKDSYASKGQYSTLAGRLEGLKTDLENEKKGLQELEGRLDEAQTNVEGKEAHQQELKSSKEEDEVKLEELLTRYGDISSESISLEQKLAESMKNLDNIAEELTLTDDQKELFDELGNALSGSGENLRNLIMEYETVNERLSLLREQHEDLEDEYTKLVEQQLGE